MIMDNNSSSSRFKIFNAVYPVDNGVQLSLFHNRQLNITIEAALEFAKHGFYIECNDGEKFNFVYQEV